MLQIQQWKTIQEFELDEQQKYLIFTSLKYNSCKLWKLTLLSIVLMIVDIELSFYSTTTTTRSKVSFHEQKVE